MTKDSEWGEPLTGPEIKALGLPGETRVSAEDMPRPLRYWALLSDTPFYQLPDDHPAYIVHRYNKEHGTDFVYWAGGDEAPDDWDGGDVLWGDGLVEPTPKHPGMWTRDYPIDYLEIIGYTKKHQLVTEEASEPLQSAVSYTAPANHGPAADDKGEAGERLSASIEQLDAFTPCERTVRMCIEALPEPGGFGGAESYKYIADKSLKAILPKPERAEVLVEQWRLQHERAIYPKSHTVTVAEDVIRWLIERGEIKG